MPFKPGQSGNPAGRPKRQTFRDVLRAYLWTPHPDRADRTRFQVWCEEMIAEATRIDQRMELLKWLDGASPPQVKGPDPEELDGAESIDEHGNVIT